MAEVDTFADALAHIIEEGAKRSRPLALTHDGQNCPAEAVLCGSTRDTCPPRMGLEYAPPMGDSPAAVGEEIAEVFDLLDDWNERYQYLIELGEKLPPMPEELKTECTRVHGCQSIVYMAARQKPDTKDVLEFLADSDAEIVRGLIGLLEHLFSGQHAREILKFDVEGYFHRLGLDQHLSMNRRNGLSAMVQRLKHHAEALAD
jgi:cysteine desulfurase/selenocysteine lyase